MKHTTTTGLHDSFVWKCNDPPTKTLHSGWFVITIWLHHHKAIHGSPSSKYKMRLGVAYIVTFFGWQGMVSGFARRGLFYNLLFLERYLFTFSARSRVSTSNYFTVLTKLALQFSGCWNFDGLLCGYQFVCIGTSFFLHVYAALCLLRSPCWVNKCFRHATIFFPLLWHVFLKIDALFYFV